MNGSLFRTRVSVLWVAVGVAAVASLLLYLFVPGAVEDMVAGEMEGEALTDGVGFFFTALGAFPLVMAAVTLLVGDRVNRWVNVIAGLAFGLFCVYAVVGHTLDGAFNGHVLMAAVGGVVAFLIGGLGLVGLRQPTSRAVVPESEPSRPREEATV